LAGLGPGRIEIHGAGLKAFWPFLVPLLIYALVIAVVQVTGCRVVIQNAPRRIWLGATIALGGAAVLLLAAGVLQHVSLLGRHFAPLMPCLLLPLAAGLNRLAGRGGGGRFLIVSFLGLSLASALSLRFCARHAKDDYRDAASFAIRANAGGRRVWWCADGTAGFWYGVPLSEYQSPNVGPGRVWQVAKPLSASWMTNKPPPDFVVLSKPELHDPDGLVRAFLLQNRYHPVQNFPAFTVWRKPGQN